jgi:vitamin B12 transporter
MKRLLLTTTLLGLSSPALAQTTDPTQVDELIVTATRLESRIGEAPGVRAITAADIADRQATFAGDILETVPGLSLSRNGDFGGVTTVRMRGASGDKTLVLIDGVVQNDPSSPNGGYDFSSLDLGDVERIEVLSGPQGSLWGSDAIGGAIAFTTRELDGWRASAEAGSFGTVRAAAAFGLSDDRRAFGVSASAYSSDGISKAAVGTEKDGFESWTVGVNGRLTLGDTVRLDGRLRYNAAEADLDGYDAFFTFGDTADRSRSRSWTGFARITADDLLGFDQVVDISVYDLTRDSLSAFASTYDARRTTARWTAGRGVASDPFAFLLGIERDDTEASISTGATSDLGATSAFGVVRFAPLERVSVTASLRHDAPDEYDARTTGRLAGVLTLDGGVTLSASLGQGFKTPTISQTECDFCFPAGPSVGLRPESAEGWDLALAWRADDDRLWLRVTGYRLEVEDQISYGDRSLCEHRPNPDHRGRGRGGGGADRPDHRPRQLRLHRCGGPVDGGGDDPHAAERRLGQPGLDRRAAEGLPDRAGGGRTGRFRSLDLFTGETGRLHCRRPARRLGADRPPRPDRARREPDRRDLAAVAGLRRSGPRRLRRPQAA